jgi:hypothetical protein
MLHVVMEIIDLTALSFIGAMVLVVYGIAQASRRQYREERSAGRAGSQSEHGKKNSATQTVKR